MEDTLIERKKSWTFYKNLFKKALDDEIEDYRTLFNKKKTLGEGEQGKVYEYELVSEIKQSNLPSLTIKKFYIEDDEAEYIENPINSKALTFGNYVEPAASQLTNLLLLQNICPHFAYYYTTVYLERTGICDDIYPYYGFHYNEYIKNSETYEDWVMNSHQSSTWYNCYFQIIVGLYALKKYFNMKHFDLHPGNILIKTVNKGGFWTYIINDKEYNIPNLGYIFYIIDLGHAFIPDKFRTWLVDEEHCDNINDAFDIKKLIDETSESKAPENINEEIKNIITKLKNNTSYIEIFESIFLKKFNRSLGESPLEYYNLDKKIKKDTNLPKKLRKLINKCD
jgi:hypothetical protein